MRCSLQQSKPPQQSSSSQQSDPTQSGPSQDNYPMVASRQSITVAVRRREERAVILTIHFRRIMADTGSLGGLAWEGGGMALQVSNYKRPYLYTAVRLEA